MKEYARKFYKSAAWKKLRENYIREQGGLCERCLARGMLVPAQIVHHKIYISPENIKDPGITLDPENLEALCQECHNREHFAEAQGERRYTVDEMGRVSVRE